MRDAERHARRLAKTPIPGSRPLAALMHAGVAHQRGRNAAAIGHLAAAAMGLDAADMRGHAAAARFRLGKLQGTDEGRALVARAETFFRDQGVVRVDRMVAHHAPGFDD